MDSHPTQTRFLPRKLTMKKFLLPILCASLTLLAQGEPTLESTMHSYAAPTPWQTKQRFPEVTKGALAQAIELARAYLLNHQTPDGNFIYSINLATGKTKGKDNQVRQAGALWGIALLNRYRFNEPTRQALLNGINFFAENMQEVPTGGRCITYPEMPSIRTGTVALFCLSLMELLESQGKYMSETDHAKYQGLLDTHIAYLQAQELANGSWSEECDIKTGFQVPVGSPYFDGEALLVYCRAARSFGRADLLPRINDAIPKLIQQYCVDCWKPGGDTDLTKGFYQWACMAFAEYTDANWPEHRALVRDSAFSLSWWLIFENDLVHRQGNTGYAIEGLIAAWRIAQTHALPDEQKILQETALTVMSRLMPLQFQGPFMQFNPVLSNLTTAPPLSEGGITNSLDDLEVRIDTVQHQTHAMLLMHKYLFP